MPWQMQVTVPFLQSVQEMSSPSQQHHQRAMLV